MISFVCSSREPKESFKEHVIKMCGLDKKKVEFLFYNNNGEFSLTEIYNRGLKESKYDIIVYIHDDITIENTQLGSKLMKHFDNNPEYGIIGVAGTRCLTSGQWWDFSNGGKYMMGIVNHKSEGKQWESKYSNNIGNNINEAVVLDGLFLAVHKKRIKFDFDERFNGFHLYDIPFCFRNHLAGVKVGVVTNIRITHFSVGATNDKWVENKKLFEELYGDKLPVKVDRIIHKDEKLKVLIGCPTFNSDYDTEMLTLAEDLTNNNCDVTIVSQIGGNITKKAKVNNVKVSNLSEPPHYKLGDGKWQINTQNGLTPSKTGALYPITKPDFDIIISTRKEIVDYFGNLYKDIELVQLINNISNELSFNNIVKKYLVKSEELKTIVSRSYDIESDRLSIYNNVDELILALKNCIK